MKPDTLGVIGLGAAGGSVALQAARAGIERIIGYAPVPRDGVAAVKAGAVTELAQSAQRVIRDADFIVLAVPPQAAAKLFANLTRLVRGRERFLTDITTVKAPLVERALAAGLSGAFAGSHPLVDIPDGGFAAAKPDLFAGRIVYVTPAQGGDRAAREVADFWHRVLAAEPVILDADAHDRVMAYTRHLPYAVSAALAVTLASRGPKGTTYPSEALAVTQLVGGDLQAVADVLLLNRRPLSNALGDLDRSLGELRELLEANDSKGLLAWLRGADRWRNRMGS